jgi:glycosyltransferase involved in cell wall biosynthesis
MDSPGSGPSEGSEPSDGRARASLSVIVITRDEEERLGRTLESVAWADEIVVVDSGSTDETEAVARRYTDRFYVEPWEGFGRQKQRALERARGDWILSVDADEVVSPELRRSIEAVLRDPPGPRIVGYRVRLHTRLFGRWFGTRGWDAEWKKRLFRRDRARFADTLVHEGIRLDGELGRLDGVLLHYHDRGMAYELQRIARYSELGARELHERGARSGPVAAVLRGAIHFLKRYVVQGAFLYGRAGFADASLKGVYGYLKYAKLWDLGRRAREPEDPPAG